MVKPRREKSGEQKTQEGKKIGMSGMRMKVLSPSLSFFSFPSSHFLPHFSRSMNANEKKCLMIFSPHFLPNPLATNIEYIISSFLPFSLSFSLIHFLSILNSMNVLYLLLPSLKPIDEVLYLFGMYISFDSLSIFLSLSFPLTHFLHHQKFMQHLHLTSLSLFEKTEGKGRRRGRKIKRC